MHVIRADARLASEQLPLSARPETEILGEA
jgi:hypothetical protein